MAAKERRELKEGEGIRQSRCRAMRPSRDRAGLRSADSLVRAFVWRLIFARTKRLALLWFRRRFSTLRSLLLIPPCAMPCDLFNRKERKERRETEGKRFCLFHVVRVFRGSKFQIGTNSKDEKTGRLEVGCWMFDVRCSMLHLGRYRRCCGQNAALRFGSGCAGLRSLRSLAATLRKS